jgi:SHS2 domain-containing protein
MPYKFLEDIATADIAFEARGHTLNELFENAFAAVEESMVETSGVKAVIKKTLKLKNATLDGLLFDFLSALVYFKDAESLLFSKVKVKITDSYDLEATLYGEKIDPSRHDLRSDVKAVTLHMFEVKQVGKEWYCRVILDI